MQMGKALRNRSVVFALLLACGASVAGAQTTPGGQVVAPGTQDRKNGAAPCNGTDTAANASDANCVEAGPGFAAPVLDKSDKSTGDRMRNVVAFVRVDTVISRPPVSLPEGDSFSVVGSATLVKVRRSELADCLATGKRISARANASTSTTCLDRGGELLAYEECKSGSSDCVVVTPNDVAKQQGSAKP